MLKGERVLVFALLCEGWLLGALLVLGPVTNWDFSSSLSLRTLIRSLISSPFHPVLSCWQDWTTAGLWQWHSLPWR